MCNVEKWEDKSKTVLPVISVRPSAKLLQALSVKDIIFLHLFWLAYQNVFIYSAFPNLTIFKGIWYPSSIWFFIFHKILYLDKTTLGWMLQPHSYTFVRISQNYRMYCVGRDLKNQPVPALCWWQEYLPLDQTPRVPSNQALNTS